MKLSMLVVLSAVLGIVPVNTNIVSSGNKVPKPEVRCPWGGGPTDPYPCPDLKPTYEQPAYKVIYPVQVADASSDIARFWNWLQPI